MLVSWHLLNTDSIYSPQDNDDRLLGIPSSRTSAGISGHFHSRIDDPKWILLHIDRKTTLVRTGMVKKLERAKKA